MAITIAIDGPAGAGKSTIAKKIARIKNFAYIDTGAMYRACALKAIREGIDFDDIEAISTMMHNTEISIRFEGHDQQIFCDGENVTGFIRTPEVSKGASDISAIKEVRLRMVELQREIAGKTNSVLDGRDIGTFVLPDADYKIYLTASTQERAKRRYLEWKASSDKPISLHEVIKDIEYRDRQDSMRDFAPLKKAEDAVEIDTTHMSVQEVVKEILAIIENNA